MRIIVSSLCVHDTTIDMYNPLYLLSREKVAYKNLQSQKKNKRGEQWFLLSLIFNNNNKYNKNLA